MPSSRRATVLVVDDDELSQRGLVKVLARAGYGTQVAADGREALARLLGKESSIDVALVDVQMPGMDGIELTRRLRERPAEAYVPVILVTGQDDPADVERGLDAGADDYVKKPFDVTELQARVRNVLRIRRIENALRESNVTMRRDLEAAQQLQRGFIPASPLSLPGVELAWSYEPSHYVAGDMLNVLDLGGGRVAFYVADISGHGVGAAMLSIWVNRALQPEGQGPAGDGLLSRPADVCAMLEEKFSATSSRKYLALCYAVYDGTVGRVSICRSALPYPMLQAPGGSVRLVPDDGNAPIGLGLQARFVSHEVDLHPGERLFVFSDGLLEALAGAGTGEAEMMAAIERSAALPLPEQVTQLADDARAAAGDSVVDDRTLLALEVTGSPADRDSASGVPGG